MVPLVAVVNRAAVNIHFQISFSVLAFNSLGFILRSEIAGSRGNAA